MFGLFIFFKAVGSHALSICPSRAELYDHEAALKIGGMKISTSCDIKNGVDARAWRTCDSLCVFIGMAPDNLKRVKGAERKTVRGGIRRRAPVKSLPLTSIRQISECEGDIFNGWIFLATISRMGIGDAGKAIYWYQPEGSETYRVIYGDLSVKDVTPENLPK